MLESSVTIDASIDDTATVPVSGDTVAVESFSINIEALRHRQPDVAARVERAALPAGAQRVVSRDGHMTYQLQSPSGRTVWLGQSSMPSVSADALLGEFVSDGSSVVLPGMATGQEPMVLANKLPACAAVFVAEQDPAIVRMAFDLYDYTELLELGRLAIMVGEQVGEDIAALFSTYPGYVWPNHLLPMIHIDHAWCVDVEAQLERASHLVAQQQEKVANRLIETISSQHVELSNDVRRVALLSTNASSTSIANIEVISRSLGHMHWPASLSAPSRPDACHINARFEAIETCKADLVLFFDCLPGSMIALLPKSLPSVSWFWPGADLAASVHDVSRVRGGHLVWVSTRQQRDQLVAMGVDAACINLLPPGAELAGESAGQADDNQETSRELKIAVLADLPDDRPETMDVTLSSHVRLWQALQQVVATSIDQYNDDRLDDFLLEAQRQSGTIISDDSSRLRFSQWLKRIIGPSGYARAIADWLSSQSMPVTVSGANWRLHKRWQPCCQDVEFQGNQARKHSGEARVVVLPTMGDTMLARLLNAIASGNMVIARSESQPFDTLYPGLEGLAAHIHWYSTTHELMKILRQFAANPDELAAARRGQIAFVRDHHTLEHRLRCIDRMTR